MNRQTRCPSCMQPGYEGTLCPHCGYNGTNPNAPHQLSVGTVLKEQYRIGKVLGQGGFGITYLGWDLYLDMAVAIKEYYPGGLVMRDSAVTMTVSELSGTQAERFRNSRDRFLREAKMLARFSQLEEVVQVRNFFLANNTAYIVMEYVEGITLKQYVKQQGGRLEGQETLKRMESIIRTLAKVHRTGIVHRDISPDNIMVLPDGGMKLLDFGAVRTVTGAAVDKELTHSTEAILKQGYAPLEQYQKKGALGPWTDVYALCATVYSCITGSSPPDAPSRVLDGEELDRKHLAGLTESQQNALLHGLELRAEQRTPDMQTLYRELYAPEPQPEPQPEPERRPKAKKRFGALAWVSLAGIAAVLLAAVLMGVPKDVPEPPVQTLAGAALLDSGSCGANLNWTLTEDGVLTVTGSGEMHNYYGPWYAQELLAGRRQAPWNDYRDRITAVILEDGVTTVGDAAFYGCPGLTRVELGSGIVRIGMDAFMDAPLTGIDFPETLESMGTSAFQGTRLRNVTLPGKLTWVADDVFSNCPELESVTLGEDTTLSFDIRGSHSAFNRGDDNNSAITLRGYRDGIIHDYAVLFGHSFEAVGETRFEETGHMSSVATGGSVSWSFDTNTGYLRLAGEGPIATEFLGSWESSVDDPPQRDYAVDPQPWQAFRDRITAVYISPGITNVPGNCFENCHNLRDVYIPDTVEHIGFQAFLATDLDQIVLPERVRSIDSFAFNYCRNLYLAVLPQGLEELNRGVFNGCPSLEQLYMGDGTKVYCEPEKCADPFRNGKDEANLPVKLTIYSPQGQLDGGNSPAKQLAIDLGLSYRPGTFD